MEKIYSKSKVFIHTTMSIDGFIAMVDEDDWSWVLKQDVDEMASRIMNEIGAVVLGNKDFRNNKVTEDGLPYGGLKLPQFVVTHNDREPLTIGPLTFEFVTGGVKRAIEMAKKAAGGKNVAILGHSIGQQCLEAGLLDELVIHIIPVVLGDGLRLIDQLKISPVDLERIEIVSTTQTTSLRFRVIKST